MSRDEVTLAVAVDRYLRHVAIERGLSSNTLQAYGRDLSAYLDSLATRGITAPGAVTSADVATFATELRTRTERPLVASSMARMLSSVRGFHRFLLLEGLVDVDVAVDDKDLRIDVYRASGAGGQHVNRTESAVRITHLPTGLVVAIQDEKSQHKNKAKALKILKARLYEQEREAKASERAAHRKGQVGSGDRSERIRTYNFPENRISDHRTGFKAYNLDHVLAGELDPVIQSCLDADLSARLESVESV